MTTPGDSDLQIDSDSSNKSPVFDISFDNVNLEESRQHKRPGTGDVLGSLCPLSLQPSNLFHHQC